MLPGLAGFHDVELPLLGMGTRGAHALELGNKIGERECDLLGLGQSVGELDHALGDIASARVEYGHLIADEGIARTHFELELGEHGPALGLRRGGLEAHDRLAINDAQLSRIVAKRRHLDLVGADRCTLDPAAGGADRLAEVSRDNPVGQERRPRRVRALRLEDPRAPHDA